ncbi:hypothetical protein PHYSODRAFT_473714 [Phytophthora sojae]|uniref:Uncharacterized protein n=1 Tax=Phytophthora sojae (strain P6497) TaxID=1094619 RepID=G4YF99_PHYSP|nr:hypothetical protein PHYSODRAFT_473714 [Phytophthora sojae]EGZ28003.1 hypothetical protein PHYSODRAFT_473714 [Phytophthora sojae]|eukprot:XP_009515278.1 hypothetical protein PHYSODRAFT_473714 [Phytophthora sojae]
MLFAAANADQDPIPSLTGAPPLKLHVTLKHKSSRIHGQSEFDVFAKPIVSKDGSRVLYDGYSTFIDEGAAYTYLFVNGAGYVMTNDTAKLTNSETVRCIPPSALPFHTILPALNELVAIPSASIGDESIECGSGRLFKTTFSGARVAVCGLGSSGPTAYSSDFTIQVKYLNNLSAPALNRTILTCPTEANSIVMTPTAAALLTGNAFPPTSSRNLKITEHMAMEASTCKCKSKPRPCVFFHGIGNYHEMEELQDTPKNTSGRMGNMNDHAPCCTTVKYAVLNTMDYSWTSDSLQQKFCDRALRLSETSDAESGIIEDTVVVTHSMAGLVMSMALATGKCSFGEGSSWVAISSPMTGTMAVDYFQDFCNDEISAIATELLDAIGQCPMPVSRRSLMYENGKYATKKLNAAYAAAQEAYRGNVSAAMCSDSYVGLFSVYRPIMIAAGKFVPHKSSENDGLVEYQSCARGIKTKGFGNTYKDTFYTAKLNHADMVFLNGDGLFGDSRKPVKWFECLL